MSNTGQGYKVVVEVAEVESASAAVSTGPSTSVGSSFGGYPSYPLPNQRKANLAGLVRVMVHGLVNSFRPHVRRINDAFPGLRPLRFRRLLN